MNVRRLLVAVGVAAGVVGLLLAFMPGLAVGMGVDRAFVLVVGVFAAMQGVLDLRARGAVEVDQADPGDPEEGSPLPRAGADVDETLAAAARGFDRQTQARRDEVRERVRSVAVDLLARQEDCTPEEARSMLAEGSWTEDPYAAAFLGATNVANLPLAERVRDAIRPEARFARRARRAIAALAERRQP